MTLKEKLQMLETALYDLGRKYGFDIYKESNINKIYYPKFLCVQGEKRIKVCFEQIDQKEDIQNYWLDCKGYILQNLGLGDPEPFVVNQYQVLAARTINSNLTDYEKEDHALKGMVGEIGEICSIYQKDYQGHPIAGEQEHLKKELGDLLWFIAEYCTAKGWDISEIMEMNIEKLKKRYPDGFETEKSLHREQGDI